jgi:hypothetical protein
MAPKVAITHEEDVKFLLTIIKQLEGTVSTPALSVLRARGIARTSSTHCSISMKVR